MHENAIAASPPIWYLLNNTNMRPALTQPPDIFAPDVWFTDQSGPRYQQLAEHIAGLIACGSLEDGSPLPAERELAERAEVSRVTVRKAMDALSGRGLIEQRRGSGSYVRREAPRLQQSLSSLVSFSETMEARGFRSTSRVLRAGLFSPSPDEMMVLGLGPEARVARLRRLRHADDTPIALEHSTLPADVLPDPGAVGASLYEVLRAEGRAPVRAIQRISAVAIGRADSELMQLPEGAPLLKIDRTAFLGSGRPVEFTTGLYRSDIYDFVAELKHGGDDGS